MIRISFYFKAAICLILLGFVVSACRNGGTPPSDSPTPLDQKTPITEDSPTNTPTQIPPTETQIPLAAMVNDFEITEGEYQAELALYKAASGTELATEDEERVLEDLINQALLAQGAKENGFEVDKSLLQERIDQMIEDTGGAQALADWMAAYGYSEEDFRRALSRSIAAAWMRDQVISSVSKTADQVHARQILLLNAEQANDVFAQLQAGNDFFNIAIEYDPLTAGDLGWFPQGYLPHPEIEEAAFGLDAGDYSPVIETVVGYHIVQLIERDPQKPLTADALQVLQMQAINEWLEEQRESADVKLLVP
jgi:parvulin-like peptidyl-prolyl isomerase